MLVESGTYFVTLSWMVDILKTTLGRKWCLTQRDESQMAAFQTWVRDILGVDLCCVF